MHNQAELSATLADYLGPLFGGARCGVMIAEKQRNVLQAMPGAFGAPDQVTASHRVSFFDPHSNSARVLTTGRPYLSNASEGDRGIRQGYVNVFGIDRVLTVPLRDVGVLHLADADHDFDLDDLERALALAPRIASIVEVATRCSTTSAGSSWSRSSPASASRSPPARASRSSCRPRCASCAPRSTRA